MSRAIGILGCGWLGLPLAKYLCAKGHTVKGTTTNAKKEAVLLKAGIQPFVLQLTEKAVVGDFKAFGKKLEILVVNVPPKLRKPPFENYVPKMQRLVDALADTPIKKVVFVSSTSVYGNVAGKITEETPPRPTTESGRQLLEAEALFKNSPGLGTTIVRLAGLIGDDRHPVHQLSKRDELKNGDELVNLIHLNDAIRIIEKVIDDGLWHLIVNGAYPHHPTKKEYYTSEALKRKLPIPNFVNGNGKSLKKSIESTVFPTYFRYPITSFF